MEEDLRRRFPWGSVNLAIQALKWILALQYYTHSLPVDSTCLMPFEILCIVFLLDLSPTCSFTSHDLHSIQRFWMFLLFFFLPALMFWVNSSIILITKEWGKAYLYKSQLGILMSGHWEYFHGWFHPLSLSHLMQIESGSMNS